MFEHERLIDVAKEFLTLLEAWSWSIRLCESDRNAFYMETAHQRGKAVQDQGEKLLILAKRDARDIDTAPISDCIHSLDRASEAVRKQAQHCASALFAAGGNIASRPSSVSIDYITLD